MQAPLLSKLDLEFVQPYYALRQQVGPDGWQYLKVEAVNFENHAIQQCGISPSGTLPLDKGALERCLTEAYVGQEANWRSQLQGPALEEASRPIEQHIALQTRLQKASGLPITGFFDNADAERLTSSSVAAANTGQTGKTSPSAEPVKDNGPHLIPMSDLAAEYERTHQ